MSEGRYILVGMILGCVVPILYILWFVYVGTIEKPKRAWCMSQGYEPRMHNRKLHCYHRPTDRFIPVPELGSDPPRR